MEYTKDANKDPNKEDLNKGKNRIVFPGEKISEKPMRLPYTYIENKKTFSSVVGLLRDTKIIPLQGPYRATEGDTVLGIITDVKMHGYTVLLNTPSDAFLSNRETRLRLELGDIITAVVFQVNEVNNITLTKPRRLGSGRLISVPPVKVPRIIGRNNSMINMIKEKTGCPIVVGKNGFIWIGLKGDIYLAINAIRKIVREAHIPGLTDRIGVYLSPKI